MKRTPASPPTLAALIVLTTIGLALSAPAHADTPTCDGKPATIVGPGPGNVIEGTPGDDVIVTTAEVASGTNGAVNTYDGDDTVLHRPRQRPDPVLGGLQRLHHPHRSRHDKVLTQDPATRATSWSSSASARTPSPATTATEQVWAGEPNTSRLPAWSDRRRPRHHHHRRRSGPHQHRHPGTTYTDVISTGPRKTRSPTPEPAPQSTTAPTASATPSRWTAPGGTSTSSPWTTSPRPRPERQHTPALDELPRLHGLHRHTPSVHRL